MAENNQVNGPEEEALSESSTLSTGSGENVSRKKNVGGIMYVERLNSFKNAWPYTKKSDICTPHNLAMAGLVFEEGEPNCKAKCFVCYKILEDLKSSSDPWIIHKQLSPNCVLVKFGYPEKPDGYTISQVFHLLEESLANKLEDDYKQFDASMRRTLEAVARQGAENVFSENDSF